MPSKPSFQKRHYIEIARIIRASDAPLSVRAKLVADFTALFAADNPGFSSDRFVAAVEEGLIQARHNTVARPMGVSDGSRGLARKRIFGS